VIPLTRSLDHLRTHLPIAAAGEDPEGVHQVRVATRRLDSWLQLGGRRVLRSDLAWLRGRAGAVRDLDVLLLGTPPAVWASWLTGRRRTARRRLLAALDDPRLGALLDALGFLAPLANRTARAQLRRITARVIAAADDFEAHPRDIERLHALRRALRLFRYALEWLDEPTEPYRALQETFGEAGDLSMSLAYLEKCPAADQLAAERTAMLASLEKCRARSLRLWKAGRAQVEQLA
jgi:CHAD domain-containing protein